MSELLWLITNDFDTEKAKGILLSSRVSFLEHVSFFHLESIQTGLRL